MCSERVELCMNFLLIWVILSEMNASIRLSALTKRDSEVEIEATLNLNECI